jgi:ribosome biogenesis GTPase
MQLHELGWTETLTRQFQTYDAESLSPARVIREDRGRCVLATEVGEIAARVSGRFRHDARERIDLPAVGDWVAFRPRPEAGRGTIHAVLPRQSRFVRKVAGETAEAQVVAANVDVVFLVTGLDANYRLRRIERYLALAAESGARPVILLSKCDLQAEPDRFVMEVEAVAAGVPIHAVSARCGTGVERALAYLGAGETGALLGSSGVGKSSLVNRWLGEDRLRTAEVRASDGRGRHATTRRELFRLPGGQLVIDTPGLRSSGCGAIGRAWPARSATSRSWPPDAASGTAATRASRAARSSGRSETAVSTWAGSRAISSRAASSTT